MPDSPYKTYRELYCEQCEDKGCKESPGTYTERPTIKQINDCAGLRRFLSELDLGV
jgi:hypothetical protein